MALPSWQAYSYTGPVAARKGYSRPWFGERRWVIDSNAVRAVYRIVMLIL